MNEPDLGAEVITGWTKKMLKTLKQNHSDTDLKFKNLQMFSKGLQNAMTKRFIFKNIYNIWKTPLFRAAYIFILFYTTEG